MRSILPLASLALITGLLIVISCQKSDKNEPDTPPNNKPIEYVTASISGRVLDNNNQPVNGAVVKAGTATATTDLNGNFTISHVSLDKNAGFIKVQKDGFFEGSRTILVNAATVNYVSMQLIKKTVSGTVSGSSGGNVTVQGGGSVAFTGNSFVNTAGNSDYTGTVSVSTFFLNPTASNFTEIMPGALRGITTGNEETGLQSFGMIAVELNGANGEKLQLAAGKTATLTFPIPAALQAQAPATIPLWSFNDTTGLWKEEGVATKQGTNYVGTVSHFSFWNCDYPYGLVDFKAVIKDQHGNALYPALVIMKTTGDTTTSYGYGYTDSTGLVSGKIPKGKTLQLNVYNTCKTIIYTKDIGPFSTTADVGTITVNKTAVSQVTVAGTVVNCQVIPVTNGFVDISIDSIHTRAAVTNGNFSITITRCNSAPTTAVITAYDMASNQHGAASNIAVNSASVNAGQFIACGNTVSQYLNYSLNGSYVGFVEPPDTLKVVSFNANEFSVFAYRKSPNRSLVIVDFNTTGLGTVPAEAHISDGQTIYQSPFNLHITEFGATSGGYISGNFSGNLKDTVSNKLLPVSMSFRIKR